ncbi:MAG TPA: hypothetical protein VGM91_16775 [Conexibacter sp.]
MGLLIPRSRVPAVALNLLCLYAASADTLRLVVEIASITRNLHAVREAREDMANVEEFLDQLGWSTAPRTVMLWGEPDLLEAAIFGRLSDHAR